LAWLLITFIAADAHPGVLEFPPALVLSTFLLAFASFSIQHALADVRRERQRPFRRNLFAALAAGTLFCSVQTYALYALMQNQLPDTAQLDASAFLIVMAALHAMHCCVAVLFLTYVTTRALLDRYDHEYFLGVTVCTYFWHALGAIWLIILAVFLIALGMQ
jgi:cytochrome c oxidase subunit 3